MKATEEADLKQRFPDRSCKPNHAAIEHRLTAKYFAEQPTLIDVFLRFVSDALMLSLQMSAQTVRLGECRGFVGTTGK